MPDISFSQKDNCASTPVPYGIGCIKSRSTEIILDSYGFDLPNDFGTQDASVTWLHAIDDTINSITIFYPPATTNPTTPIICTDVVAIQSWLDSLGTGITYTINAFNEIILYYANPSEVTKWSFWLGTDIPDNYTNKLTPTISGVQSDAYVSNKVQVVKFENADSTYIDRFFTLGSVVLEEVILQPTDVFNLGECVECNKIIFAVEQKFYLSSGFGNIYNQDLTPYTLQDIEPGIPIFNSINETYFINSTFDIISLAPSHGGAMVDGNDIMNYLNSLLPLASEVKYVLFAVTAGGENGILFEYSNECIPIQEIKEKDTCTDIESYRYIVENGSGLLVDINEIVIGFNEDNIVLECPVSDCWTPTSICKCYGGGSETIYEDTDFNLDISFSSSLNSITWGSTGADSSDIITQAIRNCILNGNTANIEITTYNDLVYLFNADNISVDGDPNGIGSYIFTGVTEIAGSGKVRKVVVTCASITAGEACLFTNCKNEQEWRDITLSNGNIPYTVISQDLLIECPKDCITFDSIELTLCAIENTNEANIGDYILIVAKVCIETGVVIEQSMYNINNNNALIEQSLLLDSCDPAIEIQEIQSCIKDTKGIKWTQIAVVQPTVPPVVVSTLYYNQSDFSLGTPNGESYEWLPCECNLTPECCYCFCALTVPITIRTEKDNAKESEQQPAKPIKVTICSTNWRDCDLKVVKTTYTIDGVDVPLEVIKKLKYIKTVCTDPIPTFTPGTPTCATYEDPKYGTIVLNVTIFTDDLNPTNTFTIYNLADNYPGLGNIGDVYLPADELLVTACNCSPLPECITVTEECYEALVNVKGIANIGDTITVKITFNAVTNSSYYEIYHTATNSLVYSGVDPLTDIGLDLGDTATWSLGGCDEEQPEVFDIREKEVCGTIDGSVDCYELIKIYSRKPTTGELITLFYEDKFGNKITGVVVETCCTCDCVCSIPTSFYNRVCFGYASLFNGRTTSGDRVVSGADFYLEYLEVDGVVIVNSSTLLGTTTGGLTMVDMGYGLGYNKIVDLLNSNSDIQNANLQFVTAATPYSGSPSLDPMGYGLQFDDTKDVRVVLRDYIPVSFMSHYWSIRTNPDPNETYDCINDVRNAVSWSFADAQNLDKSALLQNCSVI